MKKLLLSFFLLPFLASTALGLDASVTFATFTTTEEPYVEIYLHILGNSVVKQPLNDSLFQSSIEVIMIFKQGEKIVKFDKYNLNSPPSRKSINLYDLKRFALDNGEYVLEVSVRDLNKPADSRTYRTPITVDFPSEGLMQSDIELLADFRAETVENPAVKNGYYLEALPFNFYHKKISKLIFYNEIYNSDKAIGDDFLVRYFIERVRGNGKTEVVKLGNKRRSPDKVNVLLMQMDISDLSSGNYNLVVETRNRAGELLTSKKIFFQRSNPYLDLELAKTAPIESLFVAKFDAAQLRYSLKAIAAIVEDKDVEFLNMVIADRENLEAQRRFLFSFWVARRPNEPEKAYEEYMEVARAVDDKYHAAFGHGFESDRGFIFMRYGKPDDVISVEDEPSAPPYEIWVYNYVPLTQQTNVKFLFYNPSLAGGNFQILHSTCRGEANNPQWEVELYRDAPDEIEGDDYISGTRMQDNFNRNARRYFEDY